MRRIGLFAALLAAVIVVLGVSSAIADSGKKNLKAGDLTGLEENPDVSTVAGGSFVVTLDDDAQTLTYELSYAGLEAPVTQAHIHFGKRAVNGGVSVFLCGTATATGPAGTPVCPQSGTVSRTATAADIIGPTAQGIEAAAYAELAAALRSGHAYANVHSTKWPGGEIRAQINDQDEDD